MPIRVRAAAVVTSAVCAKARALASTVRVCRGVVAYGGAAKDAQNSLDDVLPRLRDLRLLNQFERAAGAALGEAGNDRDLAAVEEPGADAAVSGGLLGGLFPAAGRPRAA
jgi:hypothetical protein